MALKSRSKLRIDPEAVYVAWQGAATDVYVVAAGDRLRGDHPAVQALGGLAFAPDGTPASEMPTVLDGVVATEEAEAAAAPPKARRSRITAATTVGELVVCQRPVLSSVGGSSEVGTIMLADDARAQGAPEAFAPLLRQFD